MSWFYVAMQREPVVMWSCFIGFTGENPPNPFPRPSRLTPFRDVAHTEGFFSSLHPIQLWGCSSRADDAARVTAAARRPDCPNTQIVTRLSSSSKPSHRPSSFSQTDDDFSTFASPSTGMMLPVVVPPIRDAFSGTKPKAPPSPHLVAKALTGK
tara:strand:- start:9954 stop:10415 length:462 start_codon:yes stop_codon:yes gene_type:complete